MNDSRTLWSKQPKLKNLLYLLTLIFGTVALIGSCAKDDDETATAAGGIEAFSSASGSFTLGSETLSGTYATSCLTSGVSSLALSGSVPSDTQALAWIFVVRGNDNITEEVHGYTDTTCTTKNHHTNLIYDNVSVGSASGSNYQVSQLYTGVELLANTTTAETWLENKYSISLTVGTNSKTSITPIPSYSLWNLSGTTFYKALTSVSSYPTSLWGIPYTKQ